MIENETKKMTRKERRNSLAKRDWEDTPELRAKILDLFRQGCTITEITARPDMPPIACLFDMRRKDEAFAAEFAATMAEHAETLIGDAMEQNQAAVDDASEPVDGVVRHDPIRAKAADQYLQAALRYAGAIAPAKYGQLVKLADAQIGNGIQISITSYANDGSQDGKSGV